MFLIQVIVHRLGRMWELFKQGQDAQARLAIAITPLRGMLKLEPGGWAAAR